jgi:FAD/FMN-containing dehydrogenase
MAVEQQTNFGGNQTWRARCYVPADEQEVLKILARHADAPIRAFGGKHSWSDIAITDGVALDLSRLDQVKPFTKDGQPFVRVGAGCRLGDLLERLHAATDRTLPTLGVILRQTIAGAISTGTHGSGRESLSHFVAGLRVAAYDMNGTPRIFEYREGDVLKAARCALGTMGVILTVDLPTVPKYKIADTLRWPKRLGDVLDMYREHPLTQFALLPYSWRLLAWERRPVGNPELGFGARFKAQFFRIQNLVATDVLFHSTLKLMLRLGKGTIKTFLAVMPRFLTANVTRIDDSVHVLTMRHDLFRHEEMELFVPESRLGEALDLLRYATEVFADEDAQAPDGTAAALRAHGLAEGLTGKRGAYVHHYPFFVRRVLPEDTLLAMGSASSEPIYSVSVFTYHAPGAREGYYGFCAYLARAMNRLFDARLHWGKHFPLGETEIARLYPDLERFRAHARATDPNGVFRNAFTARVLGLPPITIPPKTN